MARHDDDALSWGDDDPTLDVGEGRIDGGVDGGDEPRTAKPGMVTAQVTGPDGVTRTREVVHPYADDRKRPRAQRSAAENAAEDAGDAPLGSVALVTLGVLGGISALFSVGWFLAGSRFQVWGLLFLEPAGYIAAWALAVAAPVVWFVSVLVVARRRRIWQRVLVLVLGILILIPWPMLLTGLAV